MVNLFRLLTAILCPLILGFACVNFILKKDCQAGILEKTGLSFTIGSGLLTLLMFICSFLGIKFPALYLILCLFSGLILALAIRKNLNGIKDSLNIFRYKPGLAQKIIIPVIALIFLYFSFHALVTPLSYWDSWAIYGFKAKALYLNQGIPLGFFTDSTKAYAHLDYPLLLPLLEAWAYTALNSWNDQLVNIIFLAYFLSLLVIFYFNLKPLIGERFSLLLTLFLVTIPRFTLFMSSSAYADVPLTVYYFVSLACLFRWFYVSQGRGFLYLSAICLGLAAWTKNEGAVICLVNFFLFIVLVLARDRAGKESFLLIGRCAGIILAIILPWLVFKGVFHVSSYLINGQNISLGVLGSNLGRIPVIFKSFVNNAFRIGDWNLFWFTAAAAVVLSLKRNFSWATGTVLLSLLLYFLSWIFIYLVTPLEINWHLANSMDRLLIQVSPSVLFLCGLFASGLSSGCRQKKAFS